MQVFKAPTRAETAHPVINGVRDHAKDTDLTREACCRRERMEKERARVTSTLMGAGDGKLAEQRDGHRIGFVALMGLGQEILECVVSKACLA